MIGGVVAVIVDLSAGQRRAAVGAAGRRSRALDAAGGRRRAGVLVGPSGHQIITVLSLISLPPMLNAIMMIGTRILFAMGRDGLFWRKTATVSAGGTPTVAMLVTTAVAVAGIVDRHVSAAGRHRRVLPGRELRDLLPRADRAAAARARASAAVPRVGLPVVGRHRLAGAVALVIGTLVGDTANGAGALALLAVGLVGHAAFGEPSLE